MYKVDFWNMGQLRQLPQLRRKLVMLVRQE
jgi:hypothetical protein